MANGGDPIRLHTEEEKEMIGERKNTTRYDTDFFQIKSFETSVRPNNN